MVKEIKLMIDLSNIVIPCLQQAGGLRAGISRKLIAYFIGH